MSEVTDTNKLAVLLLEHNGHVACYGIFDTWNLAQRYAQTCMAGHAEPLEWERGIARVSDVGQWVIQDAAYVADDEVRGRENERASQVYWAQRDER